MGYCSPASSGPYSYVALVSEESLQNRSTPVTLTQDHPEEDGFSLFPLTFFF